MTGTAPPLEMSQSDGNFAKVLSDHFQKGGEEKMDSNEKTAGNPDPSMIAYFLSALMGSGLSAIPEGNNISSSNSAKAFNKAPSPGPSMSESLPKLPPSVPLTDLLNGDQTQSINFDVRFAPPQYPNPQETGAIPPGASLPSMDGEEKKRVVSTNLEGRFAPLQFLNPQEAGIIPPAGSTPSGYGEQEKWVESITEKETLVPSQPKNSSTGGNDSVIQQQEAASKGVKEGFLSEKMNAAMGSSSDVAAIGVKSVIPSMGEGIYKEDRGKLSLQENSSPTASPWSSRTPEPRPLTLEGVKFQKQEKASLPQMESRATSGPLNSTPLEGISLPENQTQIPTSFSKSSEGGFMERGGKGQEKTLLMGNESAQFSKREVQNGLDFSGTSPMVKEGSTRIPEKLGEVKENYSPVPPKSESQTVSQQVSQRVVWLIRNNEESVRITLDPPQLGHIYMEIDRNKENIKTTLWTDNPATKATLETNQLQIQKIIESEGFKLEKFDVFVQQDLGWHQGGKDDPTNPNPRIPASPSEIRAPLSGSPDPLPAMDRARHQGSKYLDLFV